MLSKREQKGVATINHIPWVGKWFPEFKTLSWSNKATLGFACGQPSVHILNILAEGLY